jgi:hypothetical protein
LTKSVLHAAGAIVVLMGGNGCTTQGTGGSSAAGIVTVQYVRPENFADFRIQGRDVQSSASTFTREVTQALEPVMRSQFPGDRLTLQFTNVDLAGRHSQGPRSARVVRRRTPARLWFGYVLQDQSGRSVATGSQALVDTSLVSSRGVSGPVPSETQMLQRWLRRLSVPR